MGFFFPSFQNTLWNHDKFAGPIKITPCGSSHQLESKYVDCLCLSRTTNTATAATFSTTTTPRITTATTPSTTIKRQSHSLTGKTSGKRPVHVIDRQAEIWRSSHSSYDSSENTVIPKHVNRAFGLMYFKFCKNCETQLNPKGKRRVQFSSKFKR